MVFRVDVVLLQWDDGGVILIEPVHVEPLLKRTYSKTVTRISTDGFLRGDRKPISFGKRQPNNNQTTSPTYPTLERIRHSGHGTPTHGTDDSRREDRT